MDRLARTVRSWFALAVAVTLISFMVYVVAQQAYRTSADDPQSWLADDAVARLLKGVAPSSVTGSPTVDIGQTSAPFVVVFDSALKPVAWSASRQGGAPTPPDGVLSAAQARGRNSVTWQPAPGMRFATVTVSRGGWTVFAGRSLRDPERRIDSLGLGVLLGWGATVLAAFAATWLTKGRRPPG